MNKKYILKPGRHQFAPGSPPEHTNENLTDEEAEWYLERYPHIAALFQPATEKKRPAQKRPDEQSEHFVLEHQPYQSVESTIIGETLETNEDLFTTN